jgi:formate hydrogenlyase transcriptional activator
MAAGKNKKTATKVLGDEELLSRLREKDILLSVGKAIVSSRSAVELLRVIRKKAQKLIPFYDTGILIVEPDGEYHYDLCVTLPGWENSEGSLLLQEQGHNRIQHPNSYVEFVMQRIEAAQGPVIEDYEQRIKEFDYPFFQVLEEVGYKEGIVTNLKAGGRIFGTFWLNSLEQGSFDPKQFETFQTLADQVAVAVSNILANEEILEREREKSVLLSISEHIANVRDKEMLLKLIGQRIQPLFGFDDWGVFVVEKDGLFHYDFCIRAPQLSPHTINERIAAQFGHRFEHPGSVVEYVMSSETARLWNWRELSEQGWQHPALPLMVESGLVHAMIAPLRHAGEKFGVLMVQTLDETHFNENHLPLFQSVADQVAVAVSNILANEEILEREREKSLLLKISEAIASIRGREDLFKVIADKIKPLFGFTDAVVFVCDFKSNVYYVLLRETSDDRLNSEFYSSLASRTLPLAGSLEEWIVTGRDKPFICSTEEMSQMFPDAPGVRLMQEVGIRDSLLGLLRNGGQVIGSFHLHSEKQNFFQASQLEIFQSVCDQLAVAVANILANEEILEREREKATLLSISEAIATVRDKDELFGIFNQKLRPILDYDFASVLEVNNELQSYRYYLTISDQSPDANELYKEAACFRPFNQFIESVFRSESPVAYLTDELPEQYSDGAGLKLQKALGVKQSVLFLLKNAGQIIGLFILHYKERRDIKQEEIPLFRNISNQIAVAFSNILHNEETERQLAEINSLKSRLEAENTYLAEEVRKTYNFEEIVGNSPPMQTVFERVELVAGTDATVLIQGETGTGKELIARAVHSRSPRSARPLIKVNCAALPRELVESELFGHERGSFTGAHERRVGKFELAHQSTIFLDEIGELPLETQVKLLAVLQEKEIERVGGRGTIKLDLRVVAATNRNLAQEVQAGRFRADLYYRLCTVEIFVPPLRERREDIAGLTMYFARKYAAKFSRDIKKISNRMIKELYSYDFPGNVRELEHIVEQAVIFSRDETLVLPRPLTNVSADSTNETELSGFTPVPELNPKSFLAAKTLRDIEREHILAVLRQTGGRVKGRGGAAEILGLNPSTVYFRMNKLGIKKPDGSSKTLIHRKVRP